MRVVPILGLLAVVAVVASSAEDVPVAVIADKDGTDMTVTKGETGDIPASSLQEVVVAKRDLQAAATGFGGGIGGIGGGGHLGGGGFGGGYGGGQGFGGGYGSNTGFGGQKKYGGGNQFGADYGGLNKNIKLVDDKFQNSQHGTKGFKGNQGFQGTQGHVKVDAGNVNKANKKGTFGQVGHVSKAGKTDGTVYGNNNVATKFVKGTRFGNKGIHKKGHAIKGFKNTHHKDEFSKSHTFHDIKDDNDFVDKYGDEGAFNNNLAGKQFFNGHHANTLAKNNQANEGNFVAGHHNLANKGTNAVYANKGQQGHNANFGQFGGNNYAAGIGKGKSPLLTA